jgi:hypothetical protein
MIVAVPMAAVSANTNARVMREACVIIVFPVVLLTGV